MLAYKRISIINLKSLSYTDLKTLIPIVIMHSYGNTDRKKIVSNFVNTCHVVLNLLVVVNNATVSQ
jgi:hypothetical protein